MAISRVATSRAAAASGTTGAPTLPAGTQAGDLVVLAFSVQQTDVVAGDFTGWTIHSNTGDGSTWQTIVASRVYDGVWTMPTVTWGGEAAFRWWRAVSYRGSAGALSVDGAAGQHNAATATCTAPSVSPVGSADLLLMLDSPNGSCASWTPPGGMSAVDDLANCVFLAEQQLAASGATGTRAATNAAALNNVGALVAIRETITAAGGRDRLLLGVG